MNDLPFSEQIYLMALYFQFVTGKRMMVQSMWIKNSGDNERVLVLRFLPEGKREWTNAEWIYRFSRLWNKPK